METDIRMKPGLTGNSKITPTTKGSGSRHESRPRSTRDLESLKLSSVDAELPPNTGPPGKAALNGSGSQSNKNLSHVPCKFYRQGNCSAGSSCPFSHNLDGTLAADKLPCKYFQKGNCKFGLKCALAHFLPDGTRVNSKGLMNNHNGSSSRRTSSNHQNLHHTFSQPAQVAPQPIDISHSQSSGNIGSYISLGSKVPTRNPSATNLSSFRSAPSYTGAANWSHNGSNGPFSLSPTSLTTPTGTTTTSPFSPNGLGRGSYSVNSPPSTYNYSNSLVNDSAIVDDEDDEKDRSSHGFYEEDYVPGSLGNLILTPQEMQRRDSRSQSGTLLVRPTLNWGSREDRTIDVSILKGDHDKNDDVFLMD
ncbi:hypothetical protein QA089_000571 [Meyerozyma guilliermondii]